MKQSNSRRVKSGRIVLRGKWLTGQIKKPPIYTFLKIQRIILKAIKKVMLLLISEITGDRSWREQKQFQKAPDMIANFRAIKPRSINHLIDPGFCKKPFGHANLSQFGEVLQSYLPTWFSSNKVLYSLLRKSITNSNFIHFK